MTDFLTTSKFYPREILHVLDGDRIRSGGSMRSR